MLVCLFQCGGVCCVLMLCVCARVRVCFFCVCARLSFCLHVCLFCVGSRKAEECWCEEYGYLSFFTSYTHWQQTRCIKRLVSQSFVSDCSDRLLVSARFSGCRGEVPLLPGDTPSSLTRALFQKHAREVLSLEVLSHAREVCSPAAVCALDDNDKKKTTQGGTREERPADGDTPSG